MSRNLHDLHPHVQNQAEQLLATAKDLGIILGVTQTYRTFTEQADIYAQGRTKLGRIVSNAPAGYSWHNWRLAFDVDILSFVGDALPKDLYNGPWEVIGDLGEALGLEWGGRWKHPDLPHFQDVMGNTLKQMLADYPKGLS